MSLPSHLRSRISEVTTSISKDRLAPIVAKFQEMLPKELEMTINGNYRTGFYLTWNAAEQFGPDCNYEMLKLISEFFAPGALYAANKLISENSTNTWVWMSEKQVYEILNKFFSKKIVTETNADWQNRRFEEIEKGNKVTKYKKK